MKYSKLACASEELEAIRPLALHDGVEFPSVCRSILRSIPGNSHCIDCGAPGPDWASVSYGCLLCLQCSGRHRSYGVKKSFVRSIAMDTWSHSQILAMLEGGNEQLACFFDRHQMGHSGGMKTIKKRYHTKAAQFYRTNLTKHVHQVSVAGIYQGREVSRRNHRSNQQEKVYSEKSVDQRASLQPLAVS